MKYLFLLKKSSSSSSNPRNLTQSIAKASNFVNKTSFPKYPFQDLTQIHTFPTQSPQKASKFVNKTSFSTYPFQGLSFSSQIHSSFIGSSGKSFQFARGFHGCGVLNAQYQAVGEYTVEDKKGGGEDGLEISKLGVHDTIVKALAQKGITKLFPIQRAVLEPAMQGKDMIGRAKTGTGKTLAFGLPVLDKIIKFNAKHGKGRNPLAIVLAPTRELARQVDKEFYETSTEVDTLCVYGGVPISRQMSALDHGVDVVVGTPGRVIDLIKRRALNLSEVKFVILDEADQMLNVGFADDVETILENIRQEHQTMMFSATMPKWILQITNKYLKNPLFIDLVGNDDQKLAEGISLYSIASDLRQKPGILTRLITDHGKGGKVIVFTQTKRDADRLSYALKKGLKCEALHGDISQNDRERTLAGFREGRINVLVATDVAARGLDVPNVDLIIHFELPNNSEIFVHRSGRTGRAGKKGTAILIYSPDQYRDVKGIERDVGCKFTELSGISSDAGDAEATSLFSSMGRSGGGGGFGGSSGGSRFGSSGFGRFGESKGGGGRFGGSSSGRSGGFGELGSGRSGGFGERSGGGFGSSFGSSNRSGGFGSRDSKPSQRSRSNRFGGGSDIDDDIF